MSPGRLHTFTSILISLVWSQARAFPMLVNLAARSTLLSSRPTISRIAQHRSYRRSSQSGPQTGARERQRHSFVNRAALSSTMSTMSSSAAAVVQESAEDPQSTNEAAVSARVVSAEEPWLTEAGARLRAGKLVAFPTETVYGLGANALSEAAVLKIFEAKQRPLTDPLIVHVPDAARALAVVSFEGEGGGGDKAQRLLALLANKLWPGPLTLILKAAEGVPACVTANTGFVGVRCPAHPVTRQLLELAGVPVAAPSANRFGHVSPTQAVHVMEDLGASDILVLNGDASGACGVGIESTVAKIDMANDRILILRMGGVTQNRIKEALDEGGEEFLRTSVHAGSVAGGKSDKDTERLDGGNDVSAEVGRADPQGQAPGQLLRHYSPDLEVFRVLGATATTENGRMGSDGELANLPELARTSVVIDFAGQLQSLQSIASAYLDLSATGDANEAAEGLFRALRWAEGRPSAERLLIAGLPSESDGDMAAAVNDRIYRSASGKTISAV